MPAWTREKSQERVRKLSNSNDVALTLKELDRSRKDFALLVERPGTVDPAYLRKRELERQRAEQASHRLGVEGVSVNLPRFVFKPPTPPPPPPPPVLVEPELALPPPPAAMVAVEPPAPPSGPSPQEMEIAALQAELARVNARNFKLEAAVRVYRERRAEEKQAMEAERLTMARVVGRLKDEVEEGWNRVMRLRNRYESEAQQQRGGPSRRRSSVSSMHATAHANGGRMYLSEEDYDITYPSARRAASSMSHQRPQRPPLHRAPSSTSGSDSPYPSDYRPASRMSLDACSPAHQHPPSSSSRRKGVRWSDHWGQVHVSGGNISSADEEDYFGAAAAAAAAGNAPPRASELPDPHRSRSRNRQSGPPRRPKTLRMSSYDG